MTTGTDATAERYGIPLADYRVIRVVDPVNGLYASIHQLLRFDDEIMAWWMVIELLKDTLESHGGDVRHAEWSTEIPWHASAWDNFNDMDI